MRLRSMDIVARVIDLSVASCLMELIARVIDEMLSELCMVDNDTYIHKIKSK